MAGVVACCVSVVIWGRRMGACAGLKEAGVEPRLPIADAVVQAVVAVTLWTFSTRSVAYGALQFSVWLEVILLRHHCRIKAWRYLQAV